MPGIPRTLSWKKLEEQLAMGEGWAGGARVFTWPDGSALHPDVVTRTFGRLVVLTNKRITEAAERARTKPVLLPALTLHGLRHSWATTALVAGVPVKVVSDRLGHSSSRVTLDVYTASVPSMDADAATTVAAMFGVKSRYPPDISYPVPA